MTTGSNLEKSEGQSKKTPQSEGLKGLLTDIFYGLVTIDMKDDGGLVPIPPAEKEKVEPIEKFEPIDDDDNQEPWQDEID